MKTGGAKIVKSLEEQTNATNPVGLYVPLLGRTQYYFLSFVIMGIFYAVASFSNGAVFDLWPHIANPAIELKDWLHEKVGTWPMVGIGLVVLFFVLVLSYGIAALAAANLTIRIFMVSIYPLTWPVIVSGVVGWILVLIVLFAGRSPLSGARGVVLFFRR